MRACIVIFVLAGTLGCEDQRSPEAIVRAQIEAGIQGARAKDLGDVFANVDPSFQGPRGIDLRESKRMVAAQLFRPGWFGVFAHNIEVRRTDEDTVESVVDLFVARGEPVESIEDLVPSRSDSVHLELTSRGSGSSWRFIEARAHRGSGSGLPR